MAKPKDTIQEFKEKFWENKKKEAVEEAQKTLEQNLEYTIHDVIQDPSTTSRQYLIVEIKYDINTKQAVVTEIKPLYDKTIGLSIQIDKENRKYLFKRSKGKE